VSGADDAMPTPRYTVTAGGTPTPEQLAALVVALTPVAVPEPEDEVDAAGLGAGAPSNWAHAALLEGVGHRTFVALPDLAGGRFPLG
jgi:hypothetical protein